MTEAPALTDAQRKDKAIRVAYTKANAKVRNKHRDEFNEAMTEFAKEEGYDWSPRTTAEDRARAEIDRLLTEFPKVREEFEAALAPTPE